MLLRLSLFALLLVFCLGCEPPHHVEPPATRPATITIALSEDPGKLERPPVRFDHAEHTGSLDEDCALCHLKSEGALVFKSARIESGGEKGDLMDLYHEKCIGCHSERATEGQETGPRVCAECHVKQEAGEDLRRAAAFDYSLHYRHVKATGDEKCDRCHHVYDEAKQALVYVKGKEDACSDCHGVTDEGKTLSIKNASHNSCVTCHLKAKADEKKHGPTLCVGCHDGKYIAGYEKVEFQKMPRLMRGQKDRVEIALDGAKAHAVDFDHQAHEGRAPFCTTCHHKTPRPCKDCHTLTGTEEGGGVTAEFAYHLPTSNRSCVGCHIKQTLAPKCAGCHGLPMTETPPSQGTCVVCHEGPHPNPPPVDELTLGEGASDGSSEAIPSPPGGGLGRGPTWELPPTSDDFPETVVIKTLANEYKPSTMPHRKIVEKLHETIEGSKLAREFHGEVGVVCAGCHHRAPVATKPRPCSSCHGQTNEQAVDKPALKAAFHRQCMGCHEEMNIQKMGCSDCHEKANGKEVSK